MNKEMTNALVSVDPTPTVLIGADGKVEITSVELTQLINIFRKEEGNETEKQHNHLMRDIRTEIETLEKAGIGQSNFGQSSYINSQGKEQPCFRMNKSGALQMLNKESAVVRYKTIQYIEQLENNIRDRPIEFTYDQELKELENIIKLTGMDKRQRLKSVVSLLRKYNRPTLEYIEPLINPKGKLKEIAIDYIETNDPAGQACTPYYNDYLNFCHEDNLDNLSRSELGKVIKEQGYYQKTKRFNGEVKRAWFEEE